MTFLSLALPVTLLLWPYSANGQERTNGRADSSRLSRQDTVWVNTSSRVYHCPGTRYYANTARGLLMTEAEARAAGHRPAYGRTCGPVTRLSISGASVPAAARVWVNTSSHVYHCPGTRYYGATKAGRYMTEAEAKAGGNRPAGGKACS